MPNVEVTTNDIMQFLQANMVTRTEFNDFRSEFYLFKQNTEKRFDKLEDRVGSLENQMGNMVTKDYFDDKLAKLQTDINDKISQQIRRHKILVCILAEKAILNESDLERLI